MELKETYLQCSWNDPIEDVTLEDVQLAIQEVQDKDEEHGTFWVGFVSDDEEYIRSKPT